MASHQMETHCSEWLEEALLIFICPQGVSRDPFYPFTRGAFVPSERDPVLCPMPNEPELFARAHSRQSVVGV